MDENWRFVFQRLDNLEAELSELRDVTWPVCQGLKDQKSQFENIKEKRRFFRFLDIDAVRKLLRLKGEFMGKYPALDVEELRQVLVEAPRVVSGGEASVHLYGDPVK
jgi:hypothetical protein